MTVLSEVYTCAFIKMLSNGKQERHFDTISIVCSKQYKTAREGQMFSAQSEVIKLRAMVCQCACTNTPSFPPLHAPPRTNTQCLKLERSFKLEILEESKLSPPKQKNPAIWSMPLLVMHWKIKLYDVELIQIISIISKLKLISILLQYLSGSVEMLLCVSNEVLRW